MTLVDMDMTDMLIGELHSLPLKAAHGLSMAYIETAKLSPAQAGAEVMRRMTIIGPSSWDPGPDLAALLCSTWQEIGAIVPPLSQRGQASCMRSHSKGVRG